MDPRQPAARVASARATAVAAGLTGLAVLACDGGPPAAPPGFELHPDFEMQLVASEPVVFDPVDLDFDEEGRIWVLEMPGYPFPTEQGRVVRLEDADGDGTWETRTVFADGLGVADSILPVRGGLLVAAPPDLLLLRDRDGDGRGEEREVLLSGFASGNTQHNVNGLTHGIDNWIYGANGGNGGEVYVPGDDARVRLGFNDFRLRLDGPTFEITGRSSGGFEMTFDTWGRSYSTHNLYHLSQLVFPARYLPEGLPAGLHDTRQRLASEDLPGPVRIYPIGRQETRVNHPEQSGHFSGACGVTAYTGGAFGPAFDDNLLVADVVLNLVHRAVPETQGAAMGARRARPGVEFLASTDRAFRPVNLTVGPDGALYVLDMHRAVIEHPEWIPDEIEATLDLEAGKGQGRIYRIAPRAGLAPLHTIDFEPLDRDSPESLVGLLAHSNQWWRMTAQRLLVESRATAAAAALEATARGHDDPRARLHAAWTLAGLRSVDPALVQQLLADPHPRVRRQALAIAEDVLGPSELATASILLIGDDDPEVQLQATLAIAAAIAAAEDTGDAGLDEQIAGQALQRVIELDLDDPWLRRAALAVLAHRPEATLARVVTSPPWADAASLDEPSRQLLEQLATSLGAGRGSTALAAWLAPRRSAEDAAVATTAWRITRALDLDIDPGDPVRLEAAGSRAADRSLPIEERLAALRLFANRTTAMVGADAAAADRELLLDLLGADEPASLQQAAMERLAVEADVDLTAALLERWRRLGPAAREGASLVLLRHRENHPLLLDALEAGRVTLGEMRFDLERRRALLRSADPDVRQRAESLFSDAGVQTRSEALAAMRPALALTGDPQRGREHFSRLCAGCHRFDGDGGAVGPDLTGIARKSAETLLHDIVDPNAAVENAYLSYSVETVEGELLSGILLSESDTGIVLRDATGADTEVARERISDMWTGGLSMMPEELEAGMSAQDFSDLLEYLQR